MASLGILFIAGVVVLTQAGAAVSAPARESPAATSAISIPAERIDRAIRLLDERARSFQQKGGVPGMAIAVVYDDKIVFMKGYGVRKAGTNLRVDSNTVFQVASVSKTIGASVIAGAVGRGIVKWTDPISKYLPGFAFSDPYVTRTATIADMYAHRSGLPGMAGDLLEELGYTRAQILARLVQEPLEPFRITYQYTNFGMTAGAQAVANAAHMSWEDLSNEVLYKPLGMKSTSSRYADFVRHSNRAALHVLVGARWVPKYIRDADPQSPAGGVSSSVRDMAQWLRFELADGKYAGKPVVDEAALLATRAPQIAKSPPDSPISRSQFYGLGTNVNYDAAGRVRLSHSGAFANGAATAFMLLPSEHLGIVVLTNGLPVGLPETIAYDFMDIAEFGKPERDWYALFKAAFAPILQNTSELAGKKPPANPAPALANSAYVGTYNNAYYGAASIIERNGHLAIVLGPKKYAFPLAHWNGNVFSVDPSEHDNEYVSALTFTLSRDGTRAAGFVVEYLNGNRFGTFSRSIP